MSNDSAAQKLSDLLLLLYEAARTPSVDAFQKKALEAIGGLVPFDASIWGIGTVIEGATEIKGAHLWNFKRDAVDILNSRDAENIVGRTIREQPGKAHVFAASEVFTDPQTEDIWRRLGDVRQVLSHGAIDSKAGLLSFFAIARRSEEKPFTDEDAHWVELLAPHLEATLQICRVSGLQHLKLNTSPRHTRSAVSDARGVLHLAEPGFSDLLREEWPEWRGPHLPQGLVPAGTPATARALSLRRITLSISGVAQQLIITATRRPMVECLSPQEGVVAEAFARGLSYKEVAKLVGRSPATVRHHLRSAYVKLGVRDKAALARVFFGARS